LKGQINDHPGECDESMVWEEDSGITMDDSDGDRPTNINLGLMGFECYWFEHDGGRRTWLLKTDIPDRILPFSASR